MTKKASKLINESVIRRWGKLAAMQPLTENFIDTLEEEEEEMEAEMEMDAEPAGEEEISILYYLVAARLCVSVCNSAHAAKTNPDNTSASRNMWRSSGYRI